VYVLSYLVAALGGQPITGPGLASQFPRLMGGTRLKTGAQSLDQGFQVLQSGGNLDLYGAHGYNDFNLQNGDGVQDVQFECFPRDPSNGYALPPVSSGVSYDLTTKSVEGTESALCQ
jgi:hypothetical protein